MFCREKNKFKDPLSWEREVHEVHNVHQTENKLEKRAENAMKNNDFRQFMNIDVLMLSQTRFFAMGKTPMGRGGGLEKNAMYMKYITYMAQPAELVAYGVLTPEKAPASKLQAQEKTRLPRSQEKHLLPRNDKRCV